MRTCRFCEEVIADQDKICGNCGYNPQTDTMTVSFIRKKKKAVAGQNQRLLGSGVKSFVFWGLIIVVFSLGVKYQGKIGDFIWKIKNIYLGNKVNKPEQALGKANQNKIIKFISVRSSKVSADKSPVGNRRIEGIFYDPQGKSYVVINGQLISEQMSFGNMVIKKINSNSVEVLQDGQEQVLTVDK